MSEGGKSEEKKKSGEHVEDIDRVLEAWELAFHRVFQISLVEKLGQLCQLSREDREKASYLYETQLGNARNGFKRRLKLLGQKFQFAQVFKEAGEVLNYNLLIAELMKSQLSCYSEEELFLIPYSALEQESYQDKLHDLQLAEVERERTELLDKQLQDEIHKMKAFCDSTDREIKNLVGSCKHIVP